MKAAVIMCSNVRFKKIISNSNSTKWSTIQGVIGRVISKLAEREADLK